MSSEFRPQLSGLATAEWLRRPATRRVLRLLAEGGHAARIVGGAVRNTLLGLPVTDIDIATTAPPEAVLGLARAAAIEAIPTGLAHGTVTLIVDGAPYEVTTLRHDVETDGRHAKVAFTDDWRADAGRRDFTFNALACDGDGRLHDYFGGLDDLAAGRVRFIGHARARIAEDTLRILRFFRFNAAYGRGAPDPDGLAACVAARDGLARLSAERVRAEVMKLLVAPRAVEMIEALFDHGLLVLLLAAAPRLHGFARLTKLEPTSPAALRLAVLAVHVAEDVDRLADRLRLSSAERAGLHHAVPPSVRRPPSEPEQKAQIYRLGHDAYRVRLLIGWARSAAPLDDRDWRAAIDLPSRWTAPKLPLGGGELVALGLPPGPRIGALLAEVEADWIAAGFVGGRDELVDDARRRIGALTSRSAR